MIVVETFLVFLIGASLIFYIWSAICTLRFFATKQEIPVSGEDSIPENSTSILIPVCGVEVGARENWESFCTQDFERYEVLFGVKDPEDPAIPVLQEVIAKYPDRAKLFFGLEPRGINYQISNLMHLLEAAQYENIIFTDSDMRVTPDYLRTVTAPLADPKVGVVTCGYVAHDPKFLGSALASLGRCIDFIPSVLVARSLDGGLRFSLGATIVIRQSVLEQIGGVQKMINLIGSDYHIGKLANDAGYRVELSRYILETDGGKETLWQVFQRESRWAIGIRFNRGSQYYGMGFCYGTVYCIPLLLVSGFQSWAVFISLTAIAVRTIQALVAMYSMSCPKLVKWLWALPIRDLMNFATWITGAFGQSIYWRGRWLRVKPGGILIE